MSIICTIFFAFICISLVTIFVRAFNYAKKGRYDRTSYWFGTYITICVFVIVNMLFGFCKECNQFASYDEGVYCVHCGESKNSDDRIICNNCKASNKKSNDYCTNCGMPMN